MVDPGVWGGPWSWFQVPPLWGSSPWECVCRGPASLPPGRLHPGLLEGGLPTGLAIREPRSADPPPPHSTAPHSGPFVAVMVLFTPSGVLGLSRQRPLVLGPLPFSSLPWSQPAWTSLILTAALLSTTGSRCVMVAAICLVGIYLPKGNEIITSKKQLHFLLSALLIIIYKIWKSWVDD